MIVDEQPLTISVIIPNYNHAQYLPECLEAIFRQSCKPLEIIIIDDASTDSSVRFIQEIQKTHPEINLIRNQKNIGPAESLNRALQIAKGDLLAFCAADDFILPGFFEEAGLALGNEADVGICCSDPSFFKDEKPYRFETMHLRKSRIPEKIINNSIADCFLRSSLWIPSHASLFRRKLVLLYGGFDDRLKSLCDWYLNIKIALNHGIVYLPNTFGAFRISNNSYSAIWGRRKKGRNELFDVLFDVLQRESEIYKHRFRHSGVLGLINSHIILYLLIRPALWGYFPQAFTRKVGNFIRKIVRKISSSKNFLFFFAKSTLKKLTEVGNC